MVVAAPRPEERTAQRVDGYAPIRDYAVIGNKRTAALVALDGSIDWLCLPTLGDPSVFGALLDSRQGGRFALAPTIPFGVSRRYLPGTNVLETTFVTASGTVRLTDAMSRPIARGLLWNQVIRCVDGLAGTVPMAWTVEPRFAYGSADGAPARRHGVPLITHGSHVLAVQAFGAGDAAQRGGAVSGTFEASDGRTAVIALNAFDAEPLTLATRGHILDALDRTVERWRSWIADCAYAGPWRDAVVRSALALDLLVDDESGAIAAAATMALPERIGGPRNYDYRYAWLRDANLTLEAMLRLGDIDQVHVSLGWMLRTAARTQPQLRPMYRLDGDPRLPDSSLPLDGYRGSRPVLLGNGAQNQLQLGNFGHVFDMAFRYAEAGHSLAPAEGTELASLADFLVEIWEAPDSGIWELPDKRDYTQSKLASWIALDRACALADRGQLPAAGAADWRRGAERIAAYVRRDCWSGRAGAYARSAGSDELDAGVLLAGRGSLLRGQPERFNATIDAIRRELGAGGPLLYRYSGMEDEEGAFLACSFWLADALARVGRVDEATETMDALVALASDVGLYPEEIDPSTGDFLGNLPQALTHLALVNAAYAICDAASSSP
jgi:GH15 family glucan-1,4-alpha-glucosidase